MNHPSRPSTCFKNIGTATCNGCNRTVPLVRTEIPASAPVDTRFRPTCDQLSEKRS